MSQDSTVLDTDRTMTASMVLATARKEMGLSQKDVADALFLSLGFIKHIDEDEIDMIPKKAFIKGYLRSYARMVNLDPQGVVDLYGPNSVKEEPQVMMRTIKPDAISKISFTGPVLISSLIGLVCLVVIVFFVWYYASPVEEKQAVVTDVSATNIGATDTTKTVEATTPEFGEPAEVAGSAANMLLDDTLKVESNVLERPNSEATSNDAITPNTVNISESAGLSGGNEAENLDAQRASFVDVLPETISATVDEVSTGLEVSIERLSEGLTNFITVNASGSDELHVVFTDDCWLEVEDKDGNSIYGDLGRGGDDLRVSGTAPFKLLVGKPNVVSVRFNGDEIDLVPFITPARTAKLTLGEE